MVGDREQHRGDQPPAPGAANRFRADLSRALGRRSRRTDPIPEVVFAYALRGYDCVQVDRHVADLVERCRNEIVRADGAERDLQAALDRVIELQRGQIAEVREEAARLSAELDAREAQIAAALQVARQEASALRAAAEEAIARERSAAERHAETLLADVERVTRRQRQTAEQELERLTALQQSILGDLARLYARLDAESLGPEEARDRGDDGQRLTPAPNGGPGFRS